MARNDAHVLHGNFITPRDERTDALVGAVIKRRLAHEYFQSSFFPFFEILFARIGPYLYADQLSFVHIY